jgi:ABC-2 type transport system ATP-binding protein
MSIKVSGISKSFGEQKALSDIHFEVKKGEIVGFLGPNGAGKSTLMKILTTYLKSDSGEAYVNGFSVNKQAPEVQKSIGYLPEHNPLYLDMYVREYLGFHADIHKISKARIEEVIQLTGLTPEAHKPIEALSKGYRQRVGLAAALLHNPDVLILDEPTTGLDPNQIIEIRELIKAVGKDKTVFLSTHIMQEVEAICDRVMIIQKGVIKADRSLQDMVKNQEEQIIVVEFDYRVEEELVKRIPHLKSFIRDQGMWWELHFSTPKDMRPAVFDFAHDNGLKTLQLYVKKKNLEAIFREITNP